jgi:hypothetical protein
MVTQQQYGVTGLGCKRHYYYPIESLTHAVAHIYGKPVAKRVITAGGYHIS